MTAVRLTEQRDKFPCCNAAHALTMAISDELSSEVVVTTGKSDTVRIKTDFLIVGAGPAGGTLGCFLGSHGK